MTDQGTESASGYEGESLAKWIAAASLTRPQATAIVCGERSITYAELDEKARAVAAGLRHMGIRKGDIVALQLPNTPEFVIAYLAIAAVGGISQMLHMSYRQADLKQLLTHSGASAVICLDNVKDVSPARLLLDLADQIDSVQHVVVVGDAPDGTHSFAELSRFEPLEAYTSVCADDQFLLLYTSGTTADPKGAPHCYGNFLSNAARSVEEFELTSADRLMPVAPMSHLYGLYVLHLTLSSAATVVLMPVFSPPDFVEVLKRDRPTAMYAAPVHFSSSFDMALIEPSIMIDIRLVCLSGANVPPELARKINALMPKGNVIQLWGMSEIQAGSFGRPTDSPWNRLETAGRASPGTELRVVDSDGTVVDVGGEGELQVRGVSVFSGYLHNDDATRSSFSADGWFCTGDLAMLDAHGYLTITGRKTEVINRGGVKYNPVDVEAEINRIPGVGASAIVPMQDPILGERACVFLQLSTQQEISLATIKESLERAGVAKLKWPEAVRVVSSMPLTPTQKIMRGKLKALLAT